MQNSAFKTLAIGSNNAPRLIEEFSKLKTSASAQAPSQKAIWIKFKRFFGV
ncbi:hypothetical protein [uncultured Campylobacter sp.]|uniref:hypothetical protein n=1 Tax=uncultured Campylobacter sp. TaxID=218934 RepID=UPI0026239C33|nr:hypothetical protein [uncultured Campylobacter sp.]